MILPKQIHLLIPILILVILTGCVPEEIIPAFTATSLPETNISWSPPGTATDLTSPEEYPVFAYTYQQADGNRLVEGGGNLPDAEPIEITVEEEILWVVGAPLEEGSLWIVVLEGRDQMAAYYVQDGIPERIQYSHIPIPSGTPISLKIDVGPSVIASWFDDSSPFTHPVVLINHPRKAFIDIDGDLLLWEDVKEINRLELNALPDARILQDERGRLLAFSDPTEKYGHGVLGDELEAGSISLVGTDDDLTLIRKFEILPSSDVLEGMSAIWADLNGDGQREILVTSSNAGEGAQLVLYSEEGEVLARGPRVGQGFRWRHQIAAAPLGPEGEILVVDVLTPHLGGVVEFYRWEGDQLKVIASLEGFSSHGIGSRNLDMALAGDLDGDGLVEVLVPDQAKETLNGIGYRDGEAVLLWTLPLGGHLTSNLSGVAMPDGSLILGAGVENKLLVWE